jgi:hypothetical protein
MRAPHYFALWIAAPLLFAQDAADTAWQLTVRLSQVRRQAAKALDGQPDYTCLATFDRYRWLVNEAFERKLDTVRVEVAYVGGRELYSWPGEGRFSDAPLSSMVGVGLMGDGDFAVHAHNVFVSNAGSETWAGEEQENGRWGPSDRKLWRWNYRISSYQSGWQIQYADARQTVAAEGSFWVDAQTLDLVRMETHAADFVTGFPLKSVLSTVTYGRVRIGDRDVLLPRNAELKTVTTEGTESRNLTEYSGCRQYAGQSSISFGAPPEPSPEPPPPPAAGKAEARLPAGLIVYQLRSAPRAVPRTSPASSGRKSGGAPAGRTSPADPAVERTLAGARHGGPSR